MLGDFEDLESHYPGSRERRQTVPAPRPSGVDDTLLGDGTWMRLGGIRVEFFTITQVARAINRKSVTLRAWEARGILPKSGYQTSSKDPRGVRRLYSRAQAEVIIQVAIDCDVMDADSRRPLHAFKAAVWARFNALKEAQ